MLLEGSAAERPPFPGGPAARRGCRAGRGVSGSTALRASGVERFSSAAQTIRRWLALYGGVQVVSTRP